MKHSVQFALQQINKQTLKITPQIRQSLHLLRLSFNELQKEIQLELERNPLLEQDETKLAEMEQIVSESLHNCKTNLLDNLSHSLPENKSPTITVQKSIHNDFFIDQQQTPSLHTHLYWQTELTFFDNKQRQIAYTIIDYIDNRGYLTVTVTELENIFNQLNSTITVIEIEQVLTKIQQFEPTGVAARNLSECLLIQLNEHPSELKTVKLSKQIITFHLELLAQHNYLALTKILQINEAELNSCCDLIRSLIPHPGESFLRIEDNYVLPDLIIYKQHKWLAKLNENLLPNLTINQTYSDLLVTSHSADKAYLATHLQQAQMFLSGLKNRYITLLKVTQAIVDHQWRFFEYGKKKLIPLKLSDLAESLQLHESTISRATSEKYLVCEQGLFELKYFFDSAHQLADGSETSSSQIKNRIKNLIEKENKLKPFSDNQLVTLLKKEGITLARRTITKYRESLFIPASHLRKNYYYKTK